MIYQPTQLKKNPKKVSSLDNFLKLQRTSFGMILRQTVSNLLLMHTTTKGMNNLPIHKISPNIVHLQHFENGSTIPPDTSTKIRENDLCFYILPFQNIVTKEICLKCDSLTFGFQLKEDELNGHAFLKDITKKSSAASMFSNWRSTQNKVHDAFIISIDNQPIFSKQSAIEILESLAKDGVTTFNIQLGPVAKATSI